MDTTRHDHPRPIGYRGCCRSSAVRGGDRRSWLEVGHSEDVGVSHAPPSRSAEPLNPRTAQDAAVAMHPAAALRRHRNTCSLASEPTYARPSAAQASPCEACDIVHLLQMWVTPARRRWCGASVASERGMPIGYLFRFPYATLLGHPLNGPFVRRRSAFRLAVDGRRLVARRTGTNPLPPTLHHIACRPASDVCLRPLPTDADLQVPSSCCCRGIPATPSLDPLRVLRAPGRLPSQLTQSRGLSCKRLSRLRIFKTARTTWQAEDGAAHGRW